MKASWQRMVKVNPNSTTDRASRAVRRLRRRRLAGRMLITCRKNVGLIRVCVCVCVFYVINHTTHSQHTHTHTHAHIHTDTQTHTDTHIHTHTHTHTHTHETGNRRGHQFSTNGIKASWYRMNDVKPISATDRASRAVQRLG